MKEQMSCKVMENYIYILNISLILFIYYFWRN